jgi:hypothetical protein
MAKNQIMQIIKKNGAQVRTDRQQEIEKLAYQFFLDRGCEHGHDQEDWARAEAFILKKN